MGKCRICKKEIWNKEIKEGTGIKILYNNSNAFFCSEEHCKQYIDEQLEKGLEKQGLDEVYNYVKTELFRYSDKQKLCRQFFTRLLDLRNGTTRGQNYSIKNHQRNGYPWDVIISCFKSQTDNIKYWLDGKLSGAKESERINYMMAIIESNINDEYAKWQKINDFLTKDTDITWFEDAPATAKSEKVEVNKNDLSAFFDIE